jgi:NitT/TauT family transport system substrate-binding protein
LGGLAACHHPEPVLRVGSIVFPGYEFMFLARELGLLAAAEVRLLEMRSNTDVISALASGRLEAAALTMDEMLTARANGVDLRAVLVFDLSEGADVVLAKPPLRTLDALKGKVVAVEEGAVGAVMFAAMLEGGGLSLESVEKAPMTLNDSVEVFRSSKVDAIVTAEPWASLLEAEGAVRVFDSAAVPGRIVDVLAAHASRIESHPRALRQLAAAHFIAQRRFQTDPVRSAGLMAARLGVTPSDVARAFRGLKLPNVAENRALLGPGGAAQAPIQALMAVMLRGGLLKRPLDVSNVLDPRFLPVA